MKDMKRFLSILLLSLASLWSSHSLFAGESAQQESATLKWLGTAGWEIQFGGAVIFIDPFFTRIERADNAEWKTNEEEVLKVITKADYIFAGHSHADHIADIPFIAKRFGSKVIGSRTTTNIALTAGVDKSQVVTISGGEKLDYKEFSVQVIESQHGFLTLKGQKRQPKFQEVTKPWSGPVLGNAFVDGGSYLYYFTFGKHRVLHQSTGNFIEENLKGLQPDVALLAENSSYDWPDALKLLRPKTVIIHHYDEWRTPFSDGIPESNRRRAQRFAKIIKSVDNEIKVIIPQFFKPIALE
jgi:L-ascorbate metabolism protein UlaG (beta-lactamase superfamily)